MVEITYLREMEKNEKVMNCIRTFYRYHII
ncbi:hypothetical protein BJV93_003462 [Clostridium butyricum]|nr:hypothetical protein [Clostridium butyricum]